jgi:cytosine/adenosine deaminase-related metal-dependent hydrolase
MWLLYTLPMGADRSKDEVRARTLVGALESLRCGITTVQDMLGLSRSPTNRPTSSSRRIARPGSASCSPRWSGIFPQSRWSATRTAFRPRSRRCWANKPRSIRDQLDYLEHQFKRHPASGTLHWAIAPFAPQRCTPKMLQGCGELADKYDLAVYTHVYETRGQALIARELFADHQGSLIMVRTH